MLINGAADRLRFVSLTLPRCSRHATRLLVLPDAALGLPFPRRRRRVPTAAGASSRGGAVEFPRAAAGSSSAGVPAAVPARSRSAIWDDVPGNEDRRVDPRSR
jgi:hypothetical protein